MPADPSSKFYLTKRKPKHSSKRHPTGIYYIGYFLQGRLKWKSTGEEMKPDALRKLTEFKRLIMQRRETVFLSEFVQRFMEHAEENYSPKTRIIQTAVLRRLRLITGDIPLPSLTPEHFDIYKSRRLGDKIKPISVNVELRALRAIFSTALRWRTVEYHPFAGCTLVPVPQTAPAFLSGADLERLLAVIPEGWLKDVVFFAAKTGLRRGEIVNLCWRNVDMVNRKLDVETSPTFKTKLGRRRTIPFGEVVYHLLKSRENMGFSDYVFTLKDQKLDEALLTRKFKKYVRKAKLNPALKFHSLRHSHASDLVRRGVSLYEIKQLLGHSSISVTEGYSHLNVDDLRSAVEKSFSN